MQGLALQLEAARSTILKLQQYEMMYKESRMRTKQMGAELATLQVRPSPVGPGRDMRAWQLARGI